MVNGISSGLQYTCLPRLDNKGEIAIITGLRSKKDENSYFTGWDQCYSKTKK